MLLGAIIHLTLAQTCGCLHTDIFICAHTSASVQEQTHTRMHLEEAAISLSPSFFPLSYAQGHTRLSL